jgi:hypothetical protein
LLLEQISKWGRSCWSTDHTLRASLVYHFVISVGSQSGRVRNTVCMESWETEWKRKSVSTCLRCWHSQPTQNDISGALLNGKGAGSFWIQPHIHDCFEQLNHGRHRIQSQTESLCRKLELELCQSFQHAWNRKVNLREVDHHFRSMLEPG